MVESILVWVLVVAPSGHQNSPIISLPMTDLASCQQVQKAIVARSERSTQCVEVRVPVATLPKAPNK